MRKLIFVRRRADAPADATLLHGGLPTAEQFALMNAFARGDIDVIYAVAPYVAYWRAPLYDDEILVEFVGDSWTAEERLQGSRRVMPAAWRKP